MVLHLETRIIGHHLEVNFVGLRLHSNKRSPVQHLQTPTRHHYRKSLLHVQNYNALPTLRQLITALLHFPYCTLLQPTQMRCEPLIPVELAD